MADLTPLLAYRWSPRAFDPSAELTPEEAASLLEAAAGRPRRRTGNPGGSPSATGTTRPGSGS